MPFDILYLKVYIYKILYIFGAMQRFEYSCY